MDTKPSDAKPTDAKPTDAKLTDAKLTDAKLTDAKLKDAKPTDESSQSTQIIKCIYDEICSEDKMCGDCSMDMYERDKYEEDYENYKLDCKMDLYDNCLY